jgi:hypothetical protein
MNIRVWALDAVSTFRSVRRPRDGSGLHHELQKLFIINSNHRRKRNNKVRQLSSPEEPKYDSITEGKGDPGAFNAHVDGLS